MHNFYGCHIHNLVEVCVCQVLPMRNILPPSQLILPNLKCLCVCLNHVQEMDEEDCERRRMECLDEMSNLEKQFTDLKDQ